MAKSVAILQSNYLPWKGYFDIIGLVDEFIIYDEAKYTKNDWRNRNLIKTATGVQWLTVPVFFSNNQQKISETTIANLNWGVKNWRTIQANYARAPFFKDYSQQLEQFYRTFKGKRLTDVNVNLLRLVCGQLGIKTVITNSLDYRLEGNATERLVSLCAQSKATCYLTGPAAKNYLQEDLFLKQHIEITWMDYNDYTEYPQLFPPFQHGVSIIDLLFNTGPSAVSYLKCAHRWN